MSKEYSRKCDRIDRKKERERALAMAVDPMIAATRKAYRESCTFKVDALLSERSRWSRKLTIASNKLDEVNRAIALLSAELAKELDGKGKDAK